MADRDPVLVANTREWLERAREDLETAAFSLTADPPFARSALFHCQQAVEKAMKAFLTWHDLPFRKTHNLIELGDACAAVDPSLAPPVGEVAVLAKYATRFRYPGAPYHPTAEEANEGLRLARSFMASMLSGLPPEIVSDAGFVGDVPPSAK
jgi:HEPN domain-containing protein